MFFFFFGGGGGVGLVFLCVLCLLQKTNRTLRAKTKPFARQEYIISRFDGLIMEVLGVAMIVLWSERDSGSNKMVEEEDGFYLEKIPHIFFGFSKIF